MGVGVESSFAIPLTSFFSVWNVDVMELSESLRIKRFLLTMLSRPHEQPLPNLEFLLHNRFLLGFLQLIH